MDLERTKLQKAILIILLAMAVAFAVITGVTRSRKGIVFEGGLLYIGSGEGRTVYSGRIEMEDVTVTACSEGDIRVVKLTVGEMIDHTYRVEYPGGVIENSYGDYDRLRITRTDAYGREKLLFDGGCDPDAFLAEFCDMEGNPDYSANTRYVTSAGLWRGYELLPSQVMRFTEGEPTACRGDWLVYALGVFISLVTALAVAFPEHLFYWNHFLSVRDPEPTEFYMSCQRVSWVIMTAVTLIIYIVGATRIVS